MRTIMAYCALLGLVLSVGGTATGGTWSDSFDSYATGAQLHGVGGWKGWDNLLSAGALTSAAAAQSGPNSVDINGASDLVQPFNITGGHVQFKAMQYIPGNMSGTTYFLLLNEYVDGGPYDWSVQMSFNSVSNLVVSDFGGGANAPIIRDRWVPLLFDIDMDANTVSEYYNGALLSTHVWDDTNHNTLQALDLFANGATSVFYDDVSLTTVDENVIPEPATMALLAAAAAGVGGYIRRRRS